MRPREHDWTRMRFTLAEDVVFWPIRDRCGLAYRIELTSRNRFFRVGERESALISVYDGETNIAQACGRIASRWMSDAPDLQEATAITRWAVDQGLLKHTGEDGMVHRHPPDAHYQTNSHGSSRGRTGQPPVLDPLSVRFPIPHLDRLVTRVADLLTILASRSVVGLTIALIGSALVGMFYHGTCWWEASSNVISMDNWFWLWITWLLLKVVHELGHAVVCRRWGGHVGSCGFALILFSPMAFIDLTSCWRMRSRWRRMAISLGGMWVELSIAALAFWGWVWSSDPLVQFHLRNVVCAAGISTLLCNANFLMRFDGYYVLSDWVDVPNLQSRALAAVKACYLRAVTGTAIGAEPKSLSGAILVTYGLAVWAWRFTVLMFFVFASHRFLGGFGVAVVLGLLSLRWVPQYLSLARRASGFYEASPTAFFRGFAVTGSLLAIAAFTMTCVPIPTTVRGSAVTRHPSGSVVRTKTAGWTEGLHVRSGQRVRAGDRICTLQNAPLRIQHHAARCELQQVKTRLSKAIQEGDLVIRRNLEAERMAIQQRLSDLETQLDGLDIRASKSGVVVARQLPEPGTWIDQGERLIAIADERVEELVAYVDEDQVQDVMKRIGQPVQVRAADGRQWTAELVSVGPRAKSTLTEVALSAAAGGDLATFADSESGAGEPLRLLSPHFECRVRLRSPERLEQLPVGMRLKVDLGRTRATILQRLMTLSDGWSKAG